MSAETVAALPPGWCLRFIGGAMRGRTITLKPGVNLVGSAGGCEVMLPGPDVQPRHLQFVVGELAVAMERVGSSGVRLNGGEMSTARRSVVVGDRVALGRIEFEIDRVYASEEAADSMFLDQGGVRERIVPPPQRPARRLAQAWPVFGGVFGVSAIFLWWALSGPPGSGGHRPDGDIARLKLALADYPEVSLVAGSAGQMEVNGFVESQVRKTALNQALQPFSGKVTEHVQVVDALIDQARRFIGDPGVAVNYSGKGRLLMSGATESEAVRQKIQRLAEDMQPVLVSDKVQYKPAAREENTESRALWANWQSLLPAKVVSITEDADGMRHIQLANGHRYYEGALLKSGAELKLVTPDELVIGPQGSMP